MSDRASLIESVFSSKNGIKMVRGLQEDDAQSFVDVIDEARSSSIRHDKIPGIKIDDTFTFCTLGTVKLTRSFTTDPKKMS